jgi:hypothetical protein
MEERSQVGLVIREGGGRGTAHRKDTRAAMAAHAMLQIAWPEMFSSAIELDRACEPAMKIACSSRGERASVGPPEKRAEP